MRNEKYEMKRSKWMQEQIDWANEHGIWAQVQMNMAIGPAVKQYTEKWLRE